MHIEYKMIQLSPKPKSSVRSQFYPRDIVTKNIKINDIARRLSFASSFTECDVKGVYADLMEAIQNALLECYTVTLDELGTFSLVLGGRTVDNPSEIRSKSIYVKSNAFKPFYTLMASMLSAEFERTEKGTK